MFKSIATAAIGPLVAGHLDVCRAARDSGGWMCDRSYTMAALVRGGKVVRWSSTRFSFPGSACAERNLLWTQPRIERGDAVVVVRVNLRRRPRLEGGARFQSFSAARPCRYCCAALKQIPELGSVWWSVGGKALELDGTPWPSPSFASERVTANPRTSLEPPANFEPHFECPEG